MTIGSWYRLGVVLLVSLIVQQSVLDHIRIDNAHPDVMFLVAVSAGYVSGTGRGVLVGFVSGVIVDLFLPTTFGMSALVGALLAYLVALATQSLVHSSATLKVVTGTAGTAAGLCLYAVLGAVLGSPKMLTLDLVPALVVSTPAAAILTLPAMRFVGWAIGPSSRVAGARAW